MRIALVGGSGFIGSWIVRELGRAHSFLVIDRQPPPADLAGTDFLRAELPGDDISGALADLDGLVLLAGRRTGRDRTSETFADYLPSLAIAARTFEACRAAGVRNVVSLSSIAVYGPANPRPWCEDQLPAPVTLYGAMKAAVETLAGLYSREHGLAIKSLRVAQVVGPGEREGFMLATFIRRARAGERLEVWGEGAGRREYVYVRDVARAIGAALDRPDATGLFNIGTGASTSHRELAETVNEVFDNRGNLELLPDRPGDRSVQLMDVARAGATLGWRARWDLRSALADMKSAPGR
ncbi:NAD-dependent epimerase/dehydratase family protein [candidate division WOR-3 bacterium]|nr:NAD-dependent epimerase/dehydratase family protein [candidate division WOR-3 bacterium]